MWPIGRAFAPRNGEERGAEEGGRVSPQRRDEPEEEEHVEGAERSHQGAAADRGAVPRLEPPADPHGQEGKVVEETRVAGVDVGIRAAGVPHPEDGGDEVLVLVGERLAVAQAVIEPGESQEPGHAQDGGQGGVRQPAREARCRWDIGGCERGLHHVRQTLASFPMVGKPDARRGGIDDARSGPYPAAA